MLTRPCSVKHNGNITLNDVIGIARKMRHKSMAKELAGTAKEVRPLHPDSTCTLLTQTRMLLDSRNCPVGRMQRGRSAGLQHDSKDQ